MKHVFFCFQDTFEARFARVLPVESSTPAVVNAGAPSKDESSEESSSEDDSESMEREKKLAALQLQVLDIQYHNDLSVGTTVFRGMQNFEPSHGIC